MDKLWAPWRSDYVTSIANKKKKCIFCHILDEKKDSKNYIFIRTKLSFSVLNIYPYNNGHVLIVPQRHVNDLSKLKRPERDDLFDLLDETKSLLEEVMKPAGFNIGINLGRAAGAGVPEHLHIHLVPRWKGDVNFMPVTAGTKVISQSLKVLYTQLKHAYTQRH
ncbi:HIT family protein [hydrothermal vent metagenome]|uniref:HIT family protein n=1 Tax=hydrothermal vent metagenome TaxID=652676 RepID=A0A3B1D4K3_9ZZZZ